jgi:AraC family transcriptional regulator of arabinose operon
MFIFPNLNPMEYKKNKKLYHGFTGQRMLILPLFVVEEMGRDELFKDLYIHSIGHFPNAAHQYIDRPNGCPEYILMYCTKGKGWYMLNGKEYTVSENQVIILPPNEPHCYGADHINPWSIYWVHFKGSKAGFLSSGFTTPKDVSPSFEHRIALFDEIYNTLKPGYDRHNLIHACLTLGHFLSTFRYLTDGEETETENNDEFGTNIIHWVTHFMNENIDKPLKLEDIASYTGYSQKHLNHIFNRATGYAPMQYFLHLKIDHACHYLLHTSYKINQIFQILGFKDAGHFSNLFTKIKGVSPSQYRKDVRTD